MGVLQQTGLLLKKNILIRKRHPGVLLLELVWPILIVAIIAFIRAGVPPEDHKTCHYQDRAMPSAGLVPFLQTFVCNLQNKCQSKQARQNVQQSAGSVSALIQQVTPYLGDEAMLKMLDNVDFGVKLIDSFNDLAKDDTIMKEFDNVTNLARYLRDPDKVKAMLMKDFRFTQDAVDALMDSEANITKMLEISGFPDLRGVACDPGQLSQFLLFPKGTNVTEVSRALCSIDDTKIPDLTDFLLNQLDVAKLIRLLGLFESVKESLKIPYTLNQALNDVADMLDLLMSIDDISSLTDIAQIKNLPAIIRKLPGWFDTLSTSASSVGPLGDLLNTLDPLVSTIFPNSSDWMNMKDIMTLSSGLVDMFMSTGSKNTTDNIVKLTATIIEDLRNMMDGLSSEDKDILDTLTDINWMQLWEAISNNNAFNESAVMHGLDQMQRAMEQTSMWKDVRQVLSLTTDLIHSVNRVLGPIIEIGESVSSLNGNKGPLKDATDFLLSKGPNVTLAILRAFTRSDTLAMLLADGPGFSHVCYDIVAAIQNDVGQATAAELNSTLCSGDFATFITDTMQDLGVNSISAALNNTITRLAYLFNGVMLDGSESFSDLWHEAQTLSNNLQRMSHSSAVSWSDILSLEYETLMAHSENWESVADMLDENFVGSSVLALMTATGKMMNESSSANWMASSLGPLVHMAKEMTETFYEQMQLMQDTFSRTSPLGQLVYYSTNNAPQIVTALLDMNPERLDMINNLASSSDPMLTFCGDHMMQQMGLPADVGISLENAICLTNWTQTMDQVMEAQKMFDTMYLTMVKSIGSLNDKTVIYSLESDMRELTHYSSRVMDMMMSSQSITGNIMSGPWDLFMSINYTQLGVALGISMERITVLQAEDWDNILKVAVLVMENLDRQYRDMKYNHTLEAMQWRQMKLYVKIVNDYIMLGQETQVSGFGWSPQSLKDMLKFYPDEVKNWTILAADSYLEFIDQLTVFLLHPGNLASSIFSENIGAPNCADVTISTTFLMMDPTSSLGQLERELCATNWTEFSMKMTEKLQNTSPASTSLLEDMDALTSGMWIDPVVNWTQVAVNVAKTFKDLDAQWTMMNSPMVMDMWPFNMTAINAKWAEFFKNMENLKDFDFESMMSAVDQMQGLLGRQMHANDISNNELIQQLHYNMYLNIHFYKFMIAQLEYLKKTPEVDIVDLLGSEELVKLQKVLMYSPEINEIGVNTLIRIMNDPSKLKIMDLSLLCTNLTLFSEVVAVDDSVIDTGLLQKTLCDININSTVLMQQLLHKWDGYADLVQAISNMEQPSALNVSISEMIRLQMQFQELLDSVIARPPTFNSKRWMNASLYEGPWMKAWNQLETLYQQYQNPQNLLASVEKFLLPLAADPTLRPALGYLDAVLSMLQTSFSVAGYPPESLVGYPNMQKLFSLLDQLPELTEMLVYTTQLHQEQVNNWGAAMTSWDTFCKTDPTTLMTVPPGSGLNVSGVFSLLCSIDFEEYSVEQNRYLGIELLIYRIMQGSNSTIPVDVTAMAGKLNSLIDQSANLSLTLMNGHRFVNASLWEAVGERMEKYSNQAQQLIMSPEYSLQMLKQFSTMFPEIGGFQGTINQALGAADVVLDQILRNLKGGSLQELFSQYPNARKAVTLFDKLPQITETLAYTAFYTPQKLSENSQQLTSMESFCGADMTTILTAPPQSGYDLSAWQQMLCSINITVLMEELSDYGGSNDLMYIFMPNSTFSPNLTSISEKLTNVQEEFTKLFSGNSTYGMNDVINITAWTGVMQHLDKWTQDATQMWSSPSFYKQMVAYSLQSLVAVPEINTALAYTSAILDIVAVQLNQRIDLLPKTFANYTNLNTFMTLLQGVPDIFEMFAYTTLQHPEQVSRWIPAMESWETFCDTDPESLLTASPNSQLTVGNVLQRLCSLNFTEMMIELNQYQGMDKLQAVLNGGAIQPQNVTVIVDRVSGLIDSMTAQFSTPMDFENNLRLFNQTVWEQMFERLGRHLNETQQKYTSPDGLIDLYEIIFGNAQLTNSMSKGWAAMEIVLDQMLLSLKIQSGNLTEIYDKYPTVKAAFELLDYLPEIYETVVYTALFYPDKVVSRVNAFDTLVTFCTTDMRELFTVPDGVTFDLLAWQTNFCSLNLTLLMTEFADFQGAQQWEDLLNLNNTTPVDIKSVLEKMQTVLSMLEPTVPDGSISTIRFLNPTLWEQAMNNLQMWTANPNNLFWMRSDKIMQMLQQIPALNESMSFLSPSYAVMGMIAEKLLQFENQTSFTIGELFEGFPEMQKLVQMAEQPGVVEALLFSINSKKFEPLLTTSNVSASFTMLCNPSTSIDQYLTLPDTVNIDFDLLKTRLCSLDIDRLVQEFMNYFDIEHLMAAINGSVAVDYVKVSQQLTEMSELITKWSQSPPTFTVPDAWEETWMYILDYYGKTEDNVTQSVLREIKDLMRTLENELPENPFKQVLLVTEKTLQLLNENMVALRSLNLTLENMFQHVPILQDVFGALGIQGDVLDAMLKTPVKSGQMLMEALLANGTSAQESVCNMTRLQEMLSLPASFDSTALYQAVCLKDTRNAVNNLVQNLDLQSLINGFESSSTISVNSSMVNKQVDDYLRNLESLMSHPPTFDAEGFLAKLEQTFNTSDMWQIASMFNYNQIFGLLSMFPEMERAEGVMKSAAIVFEFLDDLANRLVVDGVTVDLASLFSSSPSFVKLMDAALKTEPNLLTVLMTVQIRPSKLNELMAIGPQKLPTSLCSETELEQYFFLPAGANISQIVNFFCTVNFTQFVEELNENFMVEALTKKFHAAMTGNEPLDLQRYMATYLNLVEHITALTGVTNVTFHGNDLAKAFDLNVTRLLDAMEHVSSLLQAEYPIIAAQTLNSTLASLGDSQDTKTIVLALKIVEVYLHSFNKALGDISSRPISLASIMNNTEVGKMVIPFLENPDNLEELLNMEFLPEKMRYLIGNAENITAILCGPELFTVFAAPGNKSLVLQQLQTSMCSVNTTVLMWQAIMAQANGYQLYQQLSTLSEQLATGSSSVNVTAISSDAQTLISLLTTIVEEYQSGKRSPDDLLDWRKFQDIFNRFGSSLGQRLMNVSQFWGANAAAAFVGPWYGLDELGINARIINTYNVFMNIINSRLEDMINNGISLPTMLNHSESLVKIIEAYLDVTRLSPQAWLDSQFNITRIVEVTVDQALLSEKCDAKTLASYLAGSYPVSSVTTSMQTVLCSISNLPDVFMQAFNGKAVEAQINNIWNMSKSVEPQIKQYADNAVRFNQLVTRLIYDPTTRVNPQLSSRFNLTGFLGSLEDIVTQPKMIFSLMKALSIAMDGPLSTNDNQNIFYGMSTYVAEPLLALVESMDSAGVSLTAVIHDPSKLFEALPVLMNFNLHFDLLAPIYLQPTLNKIWNYVDFRSNVFCNGSLPDDVFTTMGLQPSIVNTLCTVPTTDWIQTLRSFNASDAQIVAWVEKVEDAYKLYGKMKCIDPFVYPPIPMDSRPESCYAYNQDFFDGKGMYWLRLMTTLESVVSHLTKDGTKNADMGASLGKIWDIMKDSLRSAINYMELIDRMGEKSSKWLAFKQLLKFMQTAGDFLTSNLQKMNDPSGRVYLQNLLPDAQKMGDLLTDILGPTSAAEFLASSVNPDFFYVSASIDQLQTVACDPVQFSKVFVLPPGSNVTAVQVALCDATTTRSTSMQEFIDLFQAGDMLQQLDQLMKGAQSASDDTSLWKVLQKTVTELLTALEQLQSGQFNATISSTWLDPILQQLSSLNQGSAKEMEEMCSSVLAMVGNTAEFQPIKNVLDTVTKVLTIATKTVPFVTKLDEIVCVMATPDGLNLTALGEYMKDQGIADLLHSIAALTNGTMEKVMCSQMVSATTDITTLLTKLAEDGEQFMDVDRMAQCATQVSPHFVDVLQGLSQLYKMMTDVTGLLKDSDMRILLNNADELEEIMMIVLRTMSMQQTAILQFTDLLKNSSSVQDYLTAVMKVAPQAVDTFLSSTITLNATSFLSRRVEEIADILCHPDQLGQIIKLPSVSALSLSDISKFFCTPEVNLTAALLKDAGKSNAIMQNLATLMDGTPTASFVSDLTSGLVNLISELQSVSVLLDLFDNNFDVKFLMENADTIDAVLSGGSSINKIVDSLTTIVGTLEYLVPEEYHNYIDNAQTFIRGLLGLDLIQSRLMGTSPDGPIVQVSDLQKDVPAVERYLTNDLGLTPLAARALLSSTYSIRVFINASDLLMSEEPCEKRLHQFILMNTTMDLKDEITTKFCAMNSIQVTQFMEELVPQLDIGTVIQKYVTYSGNEFLGTLNMTKPEVEVVFKSLSDGGQSLQEAAEILIKDNSTLGPLLSYTPTNEEGRFDAMVSLQPALCGLAEDPVEDQFNLDSKVQGVRTQADIEEEEQLSGDFCKSLYRSVKDTQLGSVIWSYIKPIMSGKILYTPDTPLTREIVTKANWVFDTLGEVKHVAKKWSEKMPSLVSLTDTASNLETFKDTLNSGLVKGILKASLGVDSDSVMSGLEALESNNMSSSSMKSLQVLAELVYNYTSCLELSRFEGMATEADLERKAFELYKTKSFLGGIVFLNVESSSGGRVKRQADSSNLPKHIQYKIRMDMDNTATTNRLKDRLWRPNPNDDFADNLRYMRGFIQLQDMIEGAIISLQADTGYNDTGITMQQMPFPCHQEDWYLHYLGSYLLPVLMTFAWLSALGIATYNLVYDRQYGQEESLRIMGMKSGLNVFAWFLVTMLIMGLVSLIIMFIFKYSQIFYYSNMLIIFFYLLEFCLSTVMMCYFISAFFSRATVAILSVIIIYFITFMPFIVLISLEVDMTAWQKTLACLSSTTAFSYGAIFITRFEEETTGQQWHNMNDKTNDTVSFAWMCYMMLIDSAIYLILGWYVRNVKPGKYGVKQPWYFPVLPSYWCSCLNPRIQTLPPPKTGGTADDGYFEAAPANLDIGICMRGLRKTFSGGEEVVHGIDADIFRDQITTLLGHNGAAKTTTMNMLVGVLDPSSGTVLVEGRKPHGKTGLMGVCPQYNILFEYMTVQEHMEFYGGIKGRLSQIDRLREINKLLHDVDLSHVKDVPAKQLSGGMQRRLCVALAFVGGSTTVVLDEPTSGVDPHARKNIWNLIMKNRPGRTILMSTHHLDEADTLSDRIMMMHQGRLLSIGSPSFFKDQLGGGNKLTIHTAPAAAFTNEVESSFDTASSSGSASPETMSMDHAKVMAFIQANIPSAKFMESVGSDLMVNLPKSGDNSKILYNFFCQLDGQLKELGILSYGISNTTLEEVFLKLTCEAKDHNSPYRKRPSYNTESTETESTTDGNILNKPAGNRPQRSVKGISLSFQQFGALLVKRVHHYRRNWRMILSTIILPLIAFCCALGFATLENTQRDMQNLLMSPALYSQKHTDSYSFFQDNINTHASQHFKDMLMADNPGMGTSCMAGFNPGGDFTCIMPGALYPSEKMEQSCQCNNFQTECTPGNQTEGVWQKLTRPNMVLQDMGVMDIDQYLVNSYYNYIDQRFGGLTLEPSSQSGNTNTPVARVWFNNRGYHAIPSYYNALSNNLLRSNVNSTEAHKYGISLFNHPLMLNKKQLSTDTIETGAKDIGIAMVILLALSFIPSAFMVYLTNEILSQEKHMQTISGVGTFLYWLTSFIWDMFVYCFVLGIMMIIVVIFQTNGLYENENLGAFALLVFLFGWAVLPIMYCTLRLFRSASTAYMTLFCLNMFFGILPTIIMFAYTFFQQTDDMEEAGGVLQYVFLIFPQYSLGMGMVDLITNQMQQDILQRFGEDTYVSPYDKDMLLWKYVALAGQGLIFFILTLIVHSCKRRAISMSNKMHYNASKDDEDVFNEQERVCSKDNQDALAVRELCKLYRRGMKNFPAVNHLSFGVGKGECFGLLGVNGAGKTTTFKMLTGATTPSEGDAVIYNKCLRQMRSRLGDEIGYCPQQDALDLYLSGREMLKFHAKLRGFASKDIDEVVQEQLKRLQLEVYADKPVHTYSGGNMRKLQLAVAMLGDPALLLLDEPTTGMDVATRRLAWKCITMATQRGQSVLLTSHSMDECDSLCHRLAIMVNGQLKCIGSPQHLKNKFGDGYTVLLHLHGLSHNRYSVAESFLSQFPGASIKDQHHSIAEVSIPQGAGKVADIFAAVQQIEADHQIMYYQVSQTTLDSVFVSFACKQTEEGDIDSETDSSSAMSSTGSINQKDTNFQKSLTGGTYAYMNPEYAGDNLDSFSGSKPTHAGTVPPIKVMSFDNKGFDDNLLSTKL